MLYLSTLSFNPCFNGSMYKNRLLFHEKIFILLGFNPCFNGSMYKNLRIRGTERNSLQVSILVLMDLCIKTILFFVDV